MNASLSSPNYQRRSHHRETVVYAAASGLEMLGRPMQKVLQERPKISFVIKPPRVLLGVGPVNPLIQRGEALLETALKRTFFTNHPYQLNPEEDLRFPVVKHALSTAYIRSLYGKMMGPYATVVQSESFNAYTDTLAAYTRSELLEDVYADIFLVTIGRFDEECAHRAQLWLERLVGPLVDYIFHANLDSPLPQLNRTLPLSRLHVPPVANKSGLSDPSPFDLPTSPPPTFDKAYLDTTLHILSDAAGLPHNHLSAVVPDAPSRLHTPGQMADHSLSSDHPTGWSGPGQTTGRTDGPTNTVNLNAPIPSARFSPPRTHNLDAAPSSTLPDSTQPHLANDTQDQTQGLSVSLSTSSGNMLSPSSSGFSLKAVLRQGKAKLVSSTSFSRLSELASSLGSKGRLDTKASSHRTLSPPVPQMSSLARTETQIARAPLVPRQPPTAMKRSMSKMDVEGEAGKRAFSNPLKKLKMTKKKSDNVSPTLP
ncbi:hypothetical protein ONZ45_g13667 [Pleurotus djamor]|nr:hypothetical protein ONZ45_g13667 [Pleurotus djamor]